MKTAWTIVVISAATDFVITAATGISSAMVAMGTAEFPNNATLFLSVLGGAVAFARTIQQALKGGINERTP